jgi:hypothetical protein
VGLAELSAVLWKERHLLELLLFKLETEQLLLAAGRSRWLARASGEVEMVLGELKHVELERTLATGAAAAAVGLEDNASLRELAEAAPPPWRNLLSEHRAAFLAMTDEVAELVRTNRELLSRGQRAVTHVLAGVGAGAGAEVVESTPDRYRTSARRALIDEAL